MPKVLSLFVCQNLKIIKGGNKKFYIFFLGKLLRRLASRCIVEGTPSKNINYGSLKVRGRNIKFVSHSIIEHNHDVIATK